MGGDQGDNSGTEARGLDACVLGSGTWGMALADVLARNGARVRLWDHKPARLAEMLRRGVHPKLDGYRIPAAMGAVDTLAADAIGPDALLVLAVPSHGMRETLMRLRGGGAGGRGETIVLSAKGLEVGSHMTMVEVARDVLGAEAGRRLAVLSGPSHAEEVTQRLPTTVVAAAQESAVAQRVQSWFLNDRFRVYVQSDVRGVELGGSLKNVYAIAAGAIVGLGLGDNTLAAMMTRGLAEMSRLGVALGAEAMTFAGLAGLGDLIVTCCSKHSRNRRFGELRARGRTTEQAREEIGMAIEGIRTTQSAWELAVEQKIEMPIVEAVHGMIYRDENPRDAVHALMTREPKAEGALA